MPNSEARLGEETTVPVYPGKYFHSLFLSAGARIIVKHRLMQL